MRSERPEDQGTGAAPGAAAEAAPGGEAPGPERGVEEEGESSSREAAPAQGAEAADAAAELQALKERYLRLAAEYDNFRKRTERERAESWTRAQAQLVERLLDPVDDLQRVADYSAETTSIEALLEGVQMVERKLLRVLESAGLEMIDATGAPFDPAVHEALMTAEAESPEEDHSVGQVFQKGYRFNGVLLRPARVQVKRYEG